MRDVTWSKRVSEALPQIGGVETSVLLVDARKWSSSYADEQWNIPTELQPLISKTEAFIVSGKFLKHPPFSTHRTDQTIPMRVRMLSGQQFAVELEADSTILGVKEQLSEGLQVSAPAELKLAYRGRLLDDPSKTLDQCHLRAGGLLVVISSKPPAVAVFSRSSRGTLTAAIAEHKILCPGFVQSPEGVTLAWVPRGSATVLHCTLGTVRVFRQKFTFEDAIGSHACSLEANTRVTNGIPLGSSLLLPVCTVNCVQTLKVLSWKFQRTN
jgi:hypothetical protein